MWNSGNQEKFRRFVSSFPEFHIPHLHRLAASAYFSARTFINPILWSTSPWNSENLAPPA
jgi:hypothetical protein